MGAWTFKRLAMGLRTAAQSFRRLMNHILGDVPGVFVYMDDVLIYSKSAEEYMKTVKKVIKKLRENGLSILTKKCLFGVLALDYMGYRVDSNGIAPLPRKLEAIAKFPKPAKQKHLLGHLDACKYYRRCYKKLNGRNPAEILEPLFKITTKKWQPKDSKMFEKNRPGQKLRRIQEDNYCSHITDTPRLIRTLALTTDASECAIGGVLEQFVDGIW